MKLFLIGAFVVVMISVVIPYTALFVINRVLDLFDWRIDDW